MHFDKRILMQRSKIIDHLNLISFGLVCLYLFDCAWSGAGRWIMFGPISIRMLLLGLAIIFSIPSIILNLKKIFSNIYTICLLFFFILLVINAIRGFIAGHHQEILLSDIKGFTYYAMFPTLLVTLNSKEKMETAMKFILAGSMVLAISTLFIFIDYTSFHMKIPIDFTYFFNRRVFAVNPMGSYLLRIFSFSGLYMISGCVIAFYFFLTRKNYRWVYPVCTAVCLFSIMVSFTRSIYLGLLVCIVSIILILPFLRKRIKEILSFIGTSVIVFLLITMPISIGGSVNYLNYSIEKTLLSFYDGEATDNNEVIEGDDGIIPDNSSTNNSADEIQQSFKITVESDNLRKVTLQELNEKIRSNPLFGQGLGAAVECRTSGMTEFFYMDFIHKTGFLGLIIYLLPVLILIGISIGRLMHGNINESNLMKYTLLASLLAFMAFSFFNPYMNAALGVTMFSVTMAINSIDEKR